GELMENSDIVKEERKSKILAYLSSKEYVPLRRRELVTVLDVPKSDEEEFNVLLHALMDEGKIYISKTGRYVPSTDASKTVTGVLHCNARGYFGFVSPDSGEAEVYVAGKSLNSALDGDTVLAGIDKQASAGRFENANSEGHIIRVLKRAHTTFAGTVYEGKSGVILVKPDNMKIYAHIKISKENKALIGKRVCVEITKYGKSDKIQGKVIEVLGDRDSVRGYIDGIIIENGIKSEFDAETLAEAENAPAEITEADLKGRLDLRDELIFTIDGASAKDFDDAVSLEILENGNYYLGVHIADVTRYVTQGSALDNEAFERATSVYLADRVIPMLPERLSNGICSLNPNEDRLTLSVFMEIDGGGNVVKHSLNESVIRSKERMTYEDTNAIFDGDEALREKYAHLLPTLNAMAELAEILNKKREKRGAIQFDFPETQIKVNENAEPVDISYYTRGISNKMIEEFMLSANETVAETAFWAELPFVYRAHEAPSTDKITAFNEFLKNFGLRIKGGFGDNESVHPKALQQILDAVKDRPEERVVADSMLHSLMKADYRPECIGHFGLAAKYYCHFTSPIRRYPDLAIHRILKEYINNGTEGLSKFNAFVHNASARSSEAEVSAETAERAVDDLMKAKYMTDFVGNAYDAVITSITTFGVFVTLENSVEGLIRLQNMTDDYYEYDEKTRTLTGRRKNRIYKIGDKVRVMLMRADLQLRQVDFVFEEAADAKMLKRFKIGAAAPVPPVKKSKKRKRRKKRKKKKKEESKGQ
ncbi:MAG: ribonuclease R, partial [Firmicutes bacterium]|nr:ribonuclease R [Bacillota bacterium]